MDSRHVYPIDQDKYIWTVSMNLEKKIKFLKKIHWNEKELTRYKNNEKKNQNTPIRNILL